VWNGQSEIICTIAYVVLEHSLDVTPLLDPSDFLTACQRYDASIIAISHCHPSLTMLSLTADEVEEDI
jgi:hypothetical protein